MQVAVTVGGQQVHAGEAVDLQVDEAGRGDPAARRLQPDGLDRPVDDADVAGEQLAVDERGFHAEPHPFTAPAVRAVIRCLRASTKTITIGSE